MSATRYVNYSLICYTCLLSCPSSAAEYLFSGNIKNFSIVQDEIDTSLFSEPVTLLNQASTRLMLDVFSDNLVWQVHYGVGLNNRSEAAPMLPLGFTPESDNYRFSDLRDVIGAEGHQHELVQNLDRLNVQWQTSAGDLTMGRQAMTFGSARVINPTDVFLPFNVQALNTEYRVGIDGIRFQRPLGDLGELDLGIVLGDDARGSTSAAFARARTRLLDQDVTFTAMRFSGENLLGFGIESSLWTMGVWLEAAHVYSEDEYLRLSTGLDYGFSENWFGLVEYHYNGAGTNESNRYTTNSLAEPYQAGGVFLLGEHYLIPALTWQVSSLLSLSLQGMLNLDDQSQFISLNAEYSLSDNTYLGAGYYQFNGDDVSLTTTGIDLESEYGNSPNILFLNLRYYF